MTILIKSTGAILLLGACAIFREKKLLLKSYLAVNCVAMALLWSLGNADRIYLPF